MEVSFGTVVVERIADVLCLLIVILIAFIAEWDKLMEFLGTLGIGSGDTTFRVPVWAILALVGVAGVVATLYFFRKNERLLKIISGFKEGQ